MGLSGSAFLAAAREAKFSGGQKEMYATPATGFVALSPKEAQAQNLFQADRLSSRMIRRCARAFSHVANRGTFEEIKKCASQLGCGSGLERSKRVKLACKQAIRLGAFGNNPQLIRSIIRLEDALLSVRPEGEYDRAEQLALQSALIKELPTEAAAHTLTQSLFNLGSGLVPESIGKNVCKAQKHLPETALFLNELSGVIGQARDLKNSKGYSTGALLDAGVKEALILAEELYRDDPRSAHELAKEMIQDWKENPEEGAGRFEALTCALFDGDTLLEAQLLKRITKAW